MVIWNAKDYVGFVLIGIGVLVFVILAIFALVHYANTKRKNSEEKKTKRHKTNFKDLQTMSKKELAKFLLMIDNGAIIECGICPNAHNINNCLQCYLKWLGADVEEETEDE